MVNYPALTSHTSEGLSDPLIYVHDFTNTYKSHLSSPPAVREAACLKVQIPWILQPMQKGDLLAGRKRTPFLGFTPIQGFGNIDRTGYYMEEQSLRDELEPSLQTEEQKVELEELIAYWQTENTNSKIRARYTEVMARELWTDNWGVESGVIYPLYRMAGAHMDMDKLVRLGLPGLRAEIREKLVSSAETYHSLYESMLTALDMLEYSMIYYIEDVKQALEQADQASDKLHLKRMAEVLEAIRYHAPRHLDEAMQLCWLYMLLSGSMEHGRMDVYFGDLLVQDLNTDFISELEAQELVTAYWRMILGVLGRDARVIVGGVGRRNPENGDRFTLFAIEASRHVPFRPQLSLRCNKGMNPEIFAKALDSLGEGTTFPILYNDEANVPAVMHAFDVSREEAEQYAFFGCGEYMLDHRSYGTPSGVINLVKALELTLFNGIDPLTGRELGLKLGTLSDFATIDDLWEAYQKQLKHHIDIIADQEALEYKIVGEETSLLFISMLYDDCITRGKALFEGGIRHLGGTLETYGNITASDSLVAIKKVIYEEQKITKERLMELIRTNFAGAEGERKLLLDAPKFGNDDDEADQMAVLYHEFVCNTVRNQRERTNLDSYLVVMINNDANTTLGRLTLASADGRLAFSPMSNGNAPSPGMDRNGITALFNSMTKLDAGLHAGSSQNIKFSKQMFNGDRPKLEALLDTFFELGGTSTNISVVSKEDLQNAMIEPEKYANLIVRVGGFSAYFVTLNHNVQREILERTLY